MIRPSTWLIPLVLLPGVVLLHRVLARVDSAAALSRCRASARRLQARDSSCLAAAARALARRARALRSAGRRDLERDVLNILDLHRVSLALQEDGVDALVEALEPGVDLLGHGRGRWRSS